MALLWAIDRWSRTRFPEITDRLELHAWIAGMLRTINRRSGDPRQSWSVDRWRFGRDTHDAPIIN